MTAAIEHVQAAAFDLDGTLCDSVPDLAAAAEAMREYLGMEPLPAKTVESYVGDGIGKLVHRVILRLTLVQVSSIQPQVLVRTTTMLVLLTALKLL